LPEDIVEEVGRLYGFDKLSVVLPSKEISPSVIDPILRIKSLLRNKFSSFGANELLTYSFVNEKLLKNAGQSPELAYKLTNAISPELQYYRLSLTPSLLAHVHQNIKAGHEDFALFEIGKTHSKTELDDDNLPREFGRVAAVIASKNNTSPAYYRARRFLEQLGDFRLVPYEPGLYGGHKMIETMMAPYEPSRSAMAVNDANLPVGIVGEFKMSVIKAFKLPHHCAGFEAFLSIFKQSSASAYTPLSTFPSISQDLCLEVALDTPYSQVEEALSSAIQNANVDNLNIDISLLDIFAGEEIAGKKRITFRLKVGSYSRTLTEGVVTSLISRSVESLDSAKYNRI
jgi:phenylalanyl-tRNA synthetase beta chain